MSDIALNYSGQTGDLDLTGHRLNLIEGTAAIEQQVRLRCRFFLAEWWLDERLGVPYFRDILIKNPNIELVDSLFRNAVRTTPGISAVNKMEVSIDAATRTLSVSFTATMDTGEVLVFSPFIVEI